MIVPMEHISNLSVKDVFSFDIIIKNDYSTIFIAFFWGYRSFSYDRDFHYLHPKLFSISDSSSNNFNNLIRTGLVGWIENKTTGFAEMGPLLSIGSSLESIENGIHVYQYLSLPSSVCASGLSDFSNKIYQNNNSYFLSWAILDGFGWKGWFSKFPKKSEAAIRNREKQNQGEPDNQTLLNDMDKITRPDVDFMTDNTILSLELIDNHQILYTILG